jgi:hypothetical protein
MAALALVLGTAALAPPAQATLTVLTRTAAQIAAIEVRTLEYWKKGTLPTAAQATEMGLSLNAAKNLVIAGKDGVTRRAQYMAKLDKDPTLVTTDLKTYGFVNYSPTIAAARTTILGMPIVAGHNHFTVAFLANPFFTGYSATQATYYGFPGVSALMIARGQLLKILITATPTYFAEIIMD